MSKKAFEAIWTLLDDLNRDQLTELGNEIHQRLHPGRSRQSIRIELTQGALNEGYIQLGDQVDFFPRDAVGGQNVKLGQGRMLSLRVEGYDDVIKTDIAATKRFRVRSWGNFFAMHSLRAGDFIVIERINDYEYNISPA